MQLKLATVFALFLITLNNQASEFKLKIGTQIPLQYNLGAEFNANKYIGVSGNFGVLTKPYDKAILGILKAFGTEEVYIEIIQSAFALGLVGDFGFTIHCNKKNYFRLFGQYVALSADDTPVDLIETYYNINLDGNRFNRNNEINLSMKSNLLQAGLTYGHSFALPNPRMKIDLELSVSKNISANTELFLNQNYLLNASTLINSDLEKMYFDYAYIPSINIYFTYILKQHKK